MIKALLVFAIVLFALHVGYLFGSPLVNNYMLEGKMHDLATNRAGKNVDALRQDVLLYASDKGIDLDPENLVVIKKDDGRVTIAAYYTTHVSYWNYTRHYAFYPASEEKARLTWKGRTALADGRS